jgi:hypothetical protein
VRQPCFQSVPKSASARAGTPTVGHHPDNPHPVSPPSEGASRLGGEPEGMKNRVAWGLVVVLAAVVLLKEVQ